MRKLQVGVALVAGLMAVPSAQAQSRCADWDSWGDSDRGAFCETREASMRGSGSLRVDGGQNGGVRVFGWERDEVLVEAQVWARARSDQRAEELAREVRVIADRGLVRGDGPRTGRRESWGVTFRVYVPFDTDLDLEAMNGGIRIEDVNGSIRFETLNGGVSLSGVSGDVRGHTTNGGVKVELDGAEWSGDGLDVSTTNGGVSLTIPERYSAELETGTVNGGFDFDFPITIQGKIGKRLNTTLGEGGRTIRVVTTNGGVKVRRGSGLSRSRL